MASSPIQPIYSETQTRKPPFVWAIVFLVAVLGAIILFIGLSTTRSASAPHWYVFILCDMFLPVLIGSLRLTIEVSDTAVTWRFRPLWIQRIPLDHITSVEARTYSPIGEYLGWGIRYTPWAGWAINLSGDRGVQLRLASGRRVLLGTPDPEALAAAINAARAT
jgi:hypothetical protein